MRDAVLPVGVLVLTLASLAGCAGIVPSGTPEERAHRALDKLVTDVTTPGGSMQKLSGTLSSQGYSVPFTIDYYRDGTRHANLSAAGLAFDFYCVGSGNGNAGSTIRMVNGVATESRGACPLEDSRFGAPAQILRQLALANATQHGFEVTATFVANATNSSERVGNLTILVDGSDRVRHFDLSSPGGNVSADASYDPRPNVHAPAPAARQPMAARNYTNLYDGKLQWEAESVTGAAPVSEVEVRVQDPATHARLATFPLATPYANASGFAFVFDDRDHDGNFSARDDFTLARENWTSERQFEVVVWDTWADAPVVRVNGIDAPGVASLAFALAFALALARVRHSRQRG